MEKYFHVSNKTNRDSILRSGLKPLIVVDPHIKRSPAVYLFDNKEHATYWAHWAAIESKEEIDIWSISIINDDLVIERDVHHEMKEFGAWKTSSSISAQFLQLDSTMPIPKTWNPPPFTPMTETETTLKKRVSP